MAALVAGRRSLEVMELLARSPSGQSFNAIEVELGISASSLTRLLKMLADEGWITTDAPRKYVIATRFNKLADMVNGRSPCDACARRAITKMETRTDLVTE